MSILTFLAPINESQTLSKSFLVSVISHMVLLFFFISEGQLQDQIMGEVSKNEIISVKIKDNDEVLVNHESIRKISRVLKKSPSTIAKSEKIADQGIQTQLFDAYAAQVRALIDQHKIYPRMAKRLGQSGTVEVEFRLSSLGELLELKVVKSSTHHHLDHAALAAVKRVGSFPKFPAENKNAYLIFKQKIEFSL